MIKKRESIQKNKNRKGRERKRRRVKMQNDKERKMEECNDAKMASTFFLLHIHSLLTTGKIKIVCLNTGILNSTSR